MKKSNLRRVSDSIAKKIDRFFCRKLAIKDEKYYDGSMRLKI